MREQNNGRRSDLLRRLERGLEFPMVVLAFAWLGLLILDFTYGLSLVGQTIGDVIWALFVIEFAVKLFVAPNKSRFLGRNWLTLLALFLPALRVLRPLRLIRVVRGVRVLRVVSSLNRGMKALGKAMGRRGFGYVVALTITVALGGSAGMYALERESPSGGFSTYWDALWWTAMTLTTLGAPNAPATAEGRVLNLMLAIYAFSVFGYVAAALASFFVERDSRSPDADTAGGTDLRRIREELASLHATLREMERARPARRGRFVMLESHEDGI